jgi:hypothetical protein
MVRIGGGRFDYGIVLGSNPAADAIGEIIPDRYHQFP